LKVINANKKKPVPGIEPGMGGFNGYRKSDFRTSSSRTANLCILLHTHPHGQLKVELDIQLITNEH